MAVLIEAICVVVRRDAIAEKLAGGWDGFLAAAPRASLCADAELARAGFMKPSEAEAFIRRLEAGGLRLEDQGRALDMAVVDQIGGLTLPCDWAEFGQVNTGGGEAWVAACRRLGSTQDAIVTPDGWAYRGSLSQRTGVLKMAHAEGDHATGRTAPVERKEVLK